MVSFLRSRVNSFFYAFSGWWYVLRTQKNAWIHATASICVFGLAFWLQIPPRDWAMLILTISSVWTAEFLNTAFESLVDLSTPGHHPLAKTGKDVSAAAVLITACASVLIGLLLLGPPLWLKIATLP